MFSGLVVVVGLGVLFLWANRVVKSAVARHARRPARPLLALLVNLPAALFLLYYSYRGEKLFYRYNILEALEMIKAVVEYARSS